MPFDPRLINPDDAPLDVSGEIELPDDLLELAAQLQDDANFLASHYPAVKSPAPAPAVLARPSVVRPLGYIGGGAAALVLVAVALAYGPRTEVADIPAPQTAAVAPRQVPSTVNVTAQPSPAKAAAPRSGPRIERLPWAPQPALREVSGPELEGLLDLWQNDEHLAETRISI